MVKGVDEKFAKVNRLTDKIIRGGYSLKDTFGRNLALIGAGIEARLDLNVSDPYSQLKVHMPKRTKRKERLVNKAFKTASLKPKGVFSIQQEFDSKYIITSLPFVQKMLYIWRGIFYKIKSRNEPSSLSSNEYGVVGGLLSFNSYTCYCRL